MTKEEFDKACRDLEPTAIKALERAMREGGAPALKASELLLAYTQGKPAQTVSVSGEVGLTVNILRFGEDEKQALTKSAPASKLIDVTPERIQ
jgi:hypothetical protein